MYSIVVTGWISVAGMQTEDWVPLEEHLLLKRANILELFISNFQESGASTRTKGDHQQAKVMAKQFHMIREL